MTVFSKYTKKELELLKQFIKTDYQSWAIGVPLSIRLVFNTPIKNALEKSSCDPHLLSVYLSMDNVDLSVLSEEFKNMPLYINSSYIEIAAIAKWRLKIGR